ncbi:hypothetical protein OGATHE_006183 [Ogataea polymorpha]|uniref:Uncharacterized protein n=1 Tax=Ogataea polymorpha TaxID=460523 RepID=A0A9P8SYQ7_9ASCO|nr:hypothetical protein OGATHE_006183 [Ogataea polymorpha]
MSSRVNERASLMLGDSPSSLKLDTSCGDEIPLRAKRRVFGPLFGSSSFNFTVVERSTLKSCRFLLFTPMTLAPTATATCISSTLLTSTKGSIPRLLEYAISSLSSSSSSILTISRTVSAPASRASRIWYLLKINSFRKIHGLLATESMAFLATSRSWIFPLNQVGSVKTEIVATPALA